MTDLTLLHAAVLAEPAEDTPRLAYADCLDERGGPGDAERAAFIRTQIELAAPLVCLYSTLDTCFDRRADATDVLRSGCRACARRADLHRRERWWVETNRHAMRTELGGLEIGLLRQGWPDDSPHALFARGFVACVGASLADVMGRQADDVWVPTDRARVWIATQPLEELELTDRMPTSEHYPVTPHDPRWASRWFRGEIPEDADAANCLPAPICDVMYALAMEGQKPDQPWWFDTSDRALEAAALAVALWLRTFR